MKFVDPDGRKIRNVAKTMMNWYPSDKLGTSDLSIKKIGCVLTAYYRIAIALGYNHTILDANKYAVDNELFEDDYLLSRENGVKLVNGLLKNTGAIKRISFDCEIIGSTSEICDKLTTLEKSDKEYFVTIRIKYNAKTGGHHMNIENNSVQLSNDEFLIFDTYENWINSSKDADSKNFTIVRLDVFQVYDLNWSMIDHESMQ